MYRYKKLQIVCRSQIQFYVDCEKNLLSIVNTWKSAYKNVDCFFEQQKIRPSIKGYDKLSRKMSNVDCNFLLEKRLLEWKYLSPLLIPVRHQS